MSSHLSITKPAMSGISSVPASSSPLHGSASGANQSIGSRLGKQSSQSVPEQNANHRPRGPRRSSGVTLGQASAICACSTRTPTGKALATMAATTGPALPALSSRGVTPSTQTTLQRLSAFERKYTPCGTTQEQWQRNCKTWTRGCEPPAHQTQRRRGKYRHEDAP